MVRTFNVVQTNVKTIKWLQRISGKHKFFSWMWRAILGRCQCLVDGSTGHLSQHYCPIPPILHILANIKKLLVAVDFISNYFGVERR